MWKTLQTIFCMVLIGLGSISIAHAQANKEAKPISIPNEKSADFRTCQDSKSKDAVAACTRLIEQPPALETRSLSYAHAFRARAFESSRLNFQAPAEYEAAILTDPDNAYAYSAKGRYLNRVKKYQEAIESFTKALEKDNGEDRAFHFGERGWAFSLAGKKLEALNDFNESLSLVPNDAAILTRRASVKIQLDDFDGGLSDTNRATKINPRYSHAYNMRALALAGKDDFDEADKQSDLAFSFSTTDAERGQAREIKAKIYEVRVNREIAKLEADKLPYVEVVPFPKAEIECETGQKAAKDLFVPLRKTMLSLSSKEVCDSADEELRATKHLDKVAGAVGCFSSNANYSEFREFLERHVEVRKRLLTTVCNISKKPTTAIEEFTLASPSTVNFDPWYQDHRFITLFLGFFSAAFVGVLNLRRNKTVKILKAREA